MIELPKDFLEMTFEEKRKTFSKLNVIDDMLFQKVAEDTGVCQEILRIILQNPTLEVIESLTQRYIRNVGSKSVVLDLICTDERGIIYNVEVQKSDDDNHVKRARYNLSNIDTYFVEKGSEYKELPTVYVVFITKFDIFKSGKTVYHIDRIVRESGAISDNGVHEIYVNASGNDESDVTELMRYFCNSNGSNEKFPLLAKRVDYFKNVVEGVTQMCELSERLRREGEASGMAQANLRVAAAMKADNKPIDEIVKYSGLSKEDIEKL